MSYLAGQSVNRLSQVLTYQISKSSKETSRIKNLPPEASAALCNKIFSLFRS